MKRPYLICYLNVSADGHIDGPFMRSEYARIPSGIFRRRWLDMNPDAVIYGSTTMALFTEGKLKEALPKAQKSYDRTDYISPVKADKHYVAINTSGTLAYAGPIVDVKGRGPHGVIHVLTEAIGDDYLEYLRSKGVSYIFCGKDKFEPEIMAEKLTVLFGIKRAIVSGGAYTDWTLLDAGLVDEVITMFNPVVDGDPDSNTIFKCTKEMKPHPAALKFKSAEPVEGGGVFISYIPENAKERE